MKCEGDGSINYFENFHLFSYASFIRLLNELIAPLHLLISNR